MSCPDENELVGYIHKALAPRAHAAVEQHLRGCPACRALVAGVADQGSGLLAPTPRPSSAGGDEPSFVADVELPAGEQVSRYVIERRIGEGGMGRVYAAQDPALARRVALKMLREEALDAGEAGENRARLMREAQTMARLSHPNVVAVHDVGTYRDQVFLAMEYVNGVTLTEWISTPRSLTEVLDVFRQAGQGLAAAHALGLVHRDFKPANVLVSVDGRVRVTDFGLARAAGDGGEGAVLPAKRIEDTAITEPHVLTRTGAVMGTPAYMPPEQIVGTRVDGRTDQFAFCVALYEALFQQRPYKGRTLRDLYGAQSAEDVLPPPPGAKVPGSVHRALLKGLKADPRERHPSMEALIVALHAGPRRSGRTLATLAGAVALVVLLAAAAYGVGRRATPEPLPQAAVAAPAPPPAAAPTSSPSPVPPPAAEVPIPAVVRTAAAKPARPKRPSPAPAQGDGVLTVHVSPWGNVTVDDRAAQSANYMDYVVPLSAGKHTVIVTHPQFGRRSETVTIEAGKTLQKNVALP